MCYVRNQWYDISCATLYVQSRQVTQVIEQFNSPDVAEIFILEKTNF